MNPNRGGMISLEHPYVEYQSTPLWAVIEKAIDDLVENQDLIEQTSREIIVGYICKQILDSHDS